ncbi:MAG: VC1465 family Xer recombination activation factor [Burkholderiales bacterium]
MSTRKHRMPHHRRKWVDPRDFADLRRACGFSRQQAADALNVAVKTVRNWETGACRVPWMAYRMLRILRGYALPGLHWEGWTIREDRLYSPEGKCFEVEGMAYLANVFAQARVWRRMYSSSYRDRFASNVLPFPDRSPQPEPQKAPVPSSRRSGGAS